MSDYKLVPVEPTEEMLVAGQEEWAHRPHGSLEDCEEARLIYKAMLYAAPVVQGEPVAWSGWGCQYPGKMPRLYGERRIAELNCDWENGDQLLHFTAAPQPAPDVTQLVEALKSCRDELLWMIERHNQQDQHDGSWIYDHQTVVEADAALAAYRKGAKK